MTADITQYLSEQKDLVDTALEAFIPESDLPGSRIYEAVRYSLFAGGKRIRPILTLTVSDMLIGDRATAMAAGCAVECIHTYSLIHDDLPCMDNDDFRRGKPSSHKYFDEATAVLAGDALQAMAFGLAVKHIKPADTARRILAEIASAAGPEGMVGGQMLDLAYEGSSCSLDELHSLHAMKTGALINASVRIGTFTGTCTNEEREALTEFGRTLGLLFQVVDDILDETGDFQKLGKTAGKDSAAQKSTFPKLMGLQKAEEYRDSLHKKAVQCLALFEKRSIILNGLCDFIYSRDH
jgi:geranylgeranyl diphosphate synthase type II